jgi:hypothetical protein
MNTNKLFTFLILFFALVVSSVSLAQSDYEKTQNFKSRHKQIEDAIKNASTMDECIVIADNIQKLRDEFSKDKALLDKSLYPDNYESSLTKLDRALEIRKSDFSQIVDLKTEVGTLKDKISDLSQQNVGLLTQIRELTIKSHKDAQTIASLEKLVSQLKANIAKRDQLVRDVVDSLLADFVNSPGSLNDVEKQSIYKKVDSGNLFYNIERTINDNIQFMKVTQTTPEDLSSMKKQYSDFNKIWNRIGPKLADVYMNQRTKAAEIANINNLFYDWNNRLNDEMWGQVNKLFREQHLAVLPFKSGDQFVNSVTAFVDDEIKNLSVKGKSQAENTFLAFTDSVYYKTIEPVWVPILVENKMMTSANKDTIDKRIAMWKEKVSPGTRINWIYIAGSAVILLLLIAFFMKGRGQKKVVVINEPPAELKQ